MRTELESAARQEVVERQQERLRGAGSSLLYTLGSRQNVGGDKKVTRRARRAGSGVMGWCMRLSALAHPPTNQPPKVTAVVVIREQLGGREGQDRGRVGILP